MCWLASTRHSTCMKEMECTPGTGTLALAEPSTSTDFGSHQIRTLTQGDLFALRAELDWLDELEHPWGPFSSYQRHLEYILSQYDAAPTEGAREAHKEDRRSLIS
jgi:hypothetical protein